MRVKEGIFMDLVLIIAYLCFAGIGASDSLLGTVWPVMRSGFGASVASAGIISFIIAVGKVIACLTSDRLSKKFGEGKVIGASAGAMAAGLLGTCLSGNFTLVCIWAAPLGVGLGFADVTLSSYVAVHYESRFNSWLHCMWGIGGSVGPVLIGWILAGGGKWNTGYLIFSIFQIFLTAWVMFTLPKWKKSIADGSTSEKAGEAKHLSLIGVLKLHGTKYMMAVFFFYCTIEQTATLWASSFLTGAKGLSAETAAAFVSALFIGVTVSRFAAGFLTLKFSDRDMIRLSCALICGGIVVMFLLPGITSAVGLILLGAGLAPVYPCMLHNTKELYGKVYAQSIMDIEMAFAFAGQTIMPPLFGVLAGGISVSIFPFWLFAALILLFFFAEKAGRIKK